MIKVKDPMLLKSICDPAKFKEWQDHTIKFYEDSAMETYEHGFGRYQLNQADWLTEIHNFFLPIARAMFESETLQPSWYQLGVYEGPKAQLHKHKDDNACTYTIDLCLYQRTMWPIWVEDKEYFLEENDALLMYGNEQLHWREAFPDPMNNVVGNVFLFYCEPDQWYFSEGPEYLNVIRGNAANSGMM